MSPRALPRSLRRVLGKYVAGFQVTMLPPPCERSDCPSIHTPTKSLMNEVSLEERQYSSNLCCSQGSNSSASYEAWTHRSNASKSRESKRLLPSSISWTILALACSGPLIRPSEGFVQAVAKPQWEKRIMHYFVGAVRESPEIMAFLEAPYCITCVFRGFATTCRNKSGMPRSSIPEIAWQGSTDEMTSPASKAVHPLPL